MEKMRNIRVVMTDKDRDFARMFYGSSNLEKDAQERLNFDMWLGQFIISSMKYFINKKIDYPKSIEGKYDTEV